MKNSKLDIKVKRLARSIKESTDVLKIDTGSLIKSANREMKTLLFTLNRVVNNGEEEHKQIPE